MEHWILDPMLHEFLSANREEIIARTREKVANRPALRATAEELEDGIPLFLTQLIGMFQTPAREAGAAAIGEGATRHGVGGGAQSIRTLGRLCRPKTAIFQLRQRSENAQQRRLCGGSRQKRSLAHARACETERGFAL